MNKIIDTNHKLQNILTTSNTISTITNDIIKRKQILEKQIHSKMFKYKSSDIIASLDISQTTKKNISRQIPFVNIYTIKGIMTDMFVIKYFTNNDEYEFCILINNKRLNPIAGVFVNGELAHKYDLKMEFIALDFEKIKHHKFLENYINLIVNKNNINYKLGMILLAYYYLIECKNPKNDTIRKLQNEPYIKILCQIFRQDIPSYIADNIQQIYRSNIV